MLIIPTSLVPHFVFFAAYGRCMEKQTKAQHIVWVFMFFFMFLSFHCMFSQWAKQLDIMFWGIFTKARIWSFYWFIIMYLSSTGKWSAHLDSVGLEINIADWITLKLDLLTVLDSCASQPATCLTHHCIWATQLHTAKLHAFITLTTRFSLC